MSTSRRDPVRELLRRRSDSLADKVIGGQGPSAQEVADLGLLARLIEIRAAAAPPRRNWWAAGVLTGTLAVASVLLFVRVRETDVELDLTVAGVKFTLVRDQVIAGAMGVASLGVSGLRDLQLPPEAGPGARPGPSVPRDFHAIHLSVDGSAKRPGVVTLAPLALGAGAAVSVQPATGNNEWALSMEAAAVPLRADIDGAVSLAVAGSPPSHVEFRSPRSVLMTGGPNDVDVDVTFPASTPNPFSPQLSVSDLSLFRIDDFIEGDRRLVRRVSTVLSGTLFLESLNGEERHIRSGEALQFEKSEGELRELRLDNNHIGLKYHGRVRGMTTGSGEGHRSLMPTYLEWLRARHALSLLWGSALYAFGLIAGALRWWGVRL